MRPAVTQIFASSKFWKSIFGQEWHGRYTMEEICTKQWISLTSGYKSSTKLRKTSALNKDRADCYQNETIVKNKPYLYSHDKLCNNVTCLFRPRLIMVVYFYFTHTYHRCMYIVHRCTLSWSLCTTAREHDFSQQHNTRRSDHWAQRPLVFCDWWQRHLPAQKPKISQAYEFTHESPLNYS